MKNLPKRIILALSAVLLASGSGSAQVLSPAYSFNTNDAVARTEGLLLSGSTFYGTALAPASGGKVGGEGTSGAVFKLNTDGTGFTNLFIFGFAGFPYLLTNADGATPGAGLVSSGNTLYGTTEKGGFYTEGIVFAVNTDGTDFTNLHNFTTTVRNSVGVLTNSDGFNPSGGLVLSGNTLYGATGGGGSFGDGTVFAIHTDGTGFANLHSFFGGTNEGATPKGSLILSGNTLYGTTSSGGGLGSGTVFALNTDGTSFTNLHSFSSLVGPRSASTNSDGAGPQSGLVLSGDVLYGTAEGGGSFGGGTVFAIHTDGTGFTNLHNFNLSDGAVPIAGLVLSGNTLYGTASAGGSLSDGTVFAINTDGTGFATLHMFTPTQPNYDSSGDYTNAGGASPVGNLILSSSTLYGATELGGANGHGTVFALNLALAPPTIQFTAAPTNGIPPATVQFSSPAVDSGGNAILGWNWSFGDGTTNSTAQNPSHIYTNVGTFFPTLSCVNNNGDPVMGSGPAIVAAYPSSILNGGFETGAFTNWTQSGGSFPSGVAAGSTYAHSGKYGAGLATGGTMGFLSQTISTVPGAVYLISFWFDSPRDYVSTNDFQVSWNGNVLLDKRNLAALGWTNIQLTVTAASTTTTLQFGYLNGNFDFGLDDVSVASAALQIQFTASPANGPSPLAVQFNAPTVDGGGNTILAWNWTFGDGSSSILQNPSHTYTNAGTFFPTLACINNSGSTVIGSGPAITAEYSRSILNSGFETATFADWTLSGQPKYILPVATIGATHSGTYGAALQTKRAGMGFLSQSISTTPGAVYLVSFWLNNPRIYNTTNDFQVAWNGNVLLDETNLTNIGWTNIQLTVTATATSTTLQFGYLNDYFPFGLDDISVSSSAQPPGIAGISLAGANLVLNGTGAISGRTYFVLMGTNLTEPFNQWEPVATNVPAADGNFSLIATNAVNPNASQRFYILDLQ